MIIDPYKIPSTCSVLRLKILCLLYQRRPAIGLNVTAITKSVRAADASVSVILHSLEGLGLVVRRAHETDRRQSLFQLTEKGRDLVDSWLPAEAALTA